jgi:hypothetical protein
MPKKLKNQKQHLKEQKKLEVKKSISERQLHQMAS